MRNALYYVSGEACVALTAQVRHEVSLESCLSRVVIADEYVGPVREHMIF